VLSTFRQCTLLAAQPPHLILFSQVVSDVVEKVGPAVANIGSAAKRPAHRSQGSGIVYTLDGYILTNSHVVEEAHSLSASLPDGHVCEAELAGDDPDSDLAVLSTNATLLTARFVDVIRSHQIDVSVSIDGDREAHDRHRTDHRGRGSYERSARGIQLLGDKAPENLSGLLSVSIDLDNHREWGLVSAFDFGASG
jgi:hypothetical protein